MATIYCGARVVNCLQSICGFGTKYLAHNLNQIEIIQVRNYAARKGTREKARKKKVKVEEKKTGFIPHNLRGKDRLKLAATSKRMDDSWKSVSSDNVWIAKYYKWRVYSFAEAVQCHRETHDPTIYNIPDASVNVTIELDMHGEKKTRILDNYTRMVSIPHPFDHGEDRSILVFTKSSEQQKSAMAAGATLAGGPELLKDIQTGELSLQDYQFVIAHPNILADMAAVRGLMKRKFPNPKQGTLGNDLDEMVLKFRNGIYFTSAKDEHELDFGWIDISVGNLTMDPSHLEANFAAVLQDVNSLRPKRDGPFITRVLLKSPPSIEKLKLDLEPYAIDSRPPQIVKDDKKKTGKQTKQDVVDEDDDDEEEEEAIRARKSA